MTLLKYNRETEKYDEVKNPEIETFLGSKEFTLAVLDGFARSVRKTDQWRGWIDNEYEDGTTFGDEYIEAALERAKRAVEATT